MAEKLRNAPYCVLYSFFTIYLFVCICVFYVVKIHVYMYLLFLFLLGCGVMINKMNE